MTEGVIYIFKNKINGKIYVGKTTREKARYKEHKRASDDSFFHFAIRKWGFDNFEYLILERLKYPDRKITNHELDILEKQYISLYGSNNSNKGYNLTDGGEGGCGCIRRKETRDKMSVSKMGELNPMKRKEVREKVSNTLKNKPGHPCSLEHKQKMSLLMLGENNPMHGCYGDKNPSFGVDWTKNISPEKYKEFCEKRHINTVGDKNPMKGKKQKKSLWRLPDGTERIMANCSVAAKHKDWVKIHSL